MRDGGTEDVITQRVRVICVLAQEVIDPLQRNVLAENPVLAVGAQGSGLSLWQ
jgi:hypothetical protein